MDFSVCELKEKKIKEMSCNGHREHVAVSVHREHRINLGRAAGICSPCDTSDKYKDNLPTACQRSCI